jgi:NADH:ubiquinone oxidoreductase subunit K
MIIAIEIMLLAVTMLLLTGFSFDDGIGQIFSIFIISLAEAKSIIGLSIIVAVYRIN